MYFTDREIDRLCLEALKASGCLPEEPAAVDIELFVEKHFETRLDLGSDLGDRILGWTCFGPKGEILLVGVSSNLSNDVTTVGHRRCRATVAHEAGHCLMHPILFMDEPSGEMFENLDFSKRRILRVEVRLLCVAIAALPFFLAGCQTVPFYEREHLNDETMVLEEDPTQIHFEQKVLYSREGSAGGRFARHRCRS